MTKVKNSIRSKKWVVQDPMCGLSYDLGDMPTEDGSSFRFTIEPEATRLTLDLVSQLSLTPTYQLLTAMLPPDKVALYFEKRVRNEIFPVLRAQYAAQWHLRHHPSDYPYNEVFWPAHGGLGPLLQCIWPTEWVSLQLGNTRNWRKAVRLALGPPYRKLHHILSSFRQVAFGGGILDLPQVSEPSIAVHYQEGIDEARRNDMFWFQRGSLDPRQVLVYLDMKVPKHDGNAVPRQVINEIKAYGFNVVCLRYGLVEGECVPTWTHSGGKGPLISEFKQRISKPHTPEQWWVTKESQQFLESVDFWMAFYKRFGVKAHIDMEVGSDRNVAQNVALDLIDGISIGWQRSEFLTGYGHQLGYHPHHVYFAWNDRTISAVENSRSRVGTVLVSGFSHDGLSYSDVEPQKLLERLNEDGASFIIALFDNLIFREDIYSKNMMELFYTGFLHWVLEDPAVAVVTKSKKPIVFQSIDGIWSLMQRAEATGRWVNLPEVLGRLPTDASRIADISVGIGISSAVTEAVALGSRGVHCDLPAMRSHPFYQWGYEKVVFDNLERLILAMKRFKIHHSNEPELGDYTKMMHQVDPFQDGLRGERVGSYVNHVLKAFSERAIRGTAIQQANELYSKMWGEDKVINLTSQAASHLKTVV